jgi:wyosine [tRNA(Phe)-imidazoG37] synthetase (radical SAM superfamily)
MSHLFGPVNSRRLGLSLGVDLVPRKTCPFDCIYCEVGPTTCKTLERREYHTEDIIRELRGFIDQGSPVDFITLTGSGEPTLNLGLGRIMEAVKAMTEIPVAALTSGALLFDPEVRRELAAADVILPSLDAAREETFQIINRPAPGFSVDRQIQGLEALRREYSGQVWLEVLILQGINDDKPELRALKEIIQRLAPDKVQLNTAVRPGVEAYARPVSAQELADIAAYLWDGAEVIAAFHGSPAPAAAISDSRFLEMLSRRPMTAPDLAQALGLPLPLVQRRLNHLCDTGRIAGNVYHNQEFFRTPEGVDFFIGKGENP